MKIRNTFIIFIVSGFWHGANWTFIVWGALNALYFLPLLLTNNNRNHLGIVAQYRYLPTVKELTQILITFGLTVFAWIFFRAENIGHALSYISGIFSISIFETPEFPRMSRAFATIFLTALFMTVEWFGRKGDYAIANIDAVGKRSFRWAFYMGICFLMLFFQGDQQEFIYFQF